MKYTALASWFGSNRMLGKHVGKLLKGYPMVAVPFCGGMSELAHLDARTMVVSDLHRHVINLGRAAAHPDLNALLIRRLNETTFHPDELTRAQRVCVEREKALELSLTVNSKIAGRCIAEHWIADTPSLEWAWAYFVCIWAARNGTAGTDKEFDAGLSVRWDAGGGDSCTRFRNATDSLRDFQKILHRCTFVCLDCFEFLGKCKDEVKHAVYVDAPWPDDGDNYKHKFTNDHQRLLAVRLAAFDKARVVVRFGDHPLVRELYPESLWQWQFLEGRTAANKAKAEVLLVRN